jgi:hypothetical protein
VRISTFILSLLLAAQIAFLPQESQAFPINFSPDINGNGGLLTVKMPLEKLGSIDIPRGRFKIKGNWAEVSTVEEFEFDHHTVLSGPVINTQQTLDRNKFEITGLAYLCHGDWLSYLSPLVFQEIVSTNTGELIGQIVSVENDSVLFRNTSGQYQKIPSSIIKDIDSPRSFRFRLAGNLPDGVQKGEAYEAEANKVNLVQVNHQFRLTALSRVLQKQGDGDLSKGKLIAIGTLINSIEIGQMAPLLVLGLCFDRLKANGLRSEYQIQTAPVGISPLISIPSNLIPPPKF